mgnify:CR=1 FL=1
MLSLLKKLAPIAGAIIGAQFGNPALGSALGGGIGSLLAGAELEDAIKTAAIAGIGGAALKGTGAETVTSTAASAPAATASAPTVAAGADALAKSKAAGAGILDLIKENPLTSLTLGTSALGLLAAEEGEGQELTDDQLRQIRTLETTDYEGDPESVPRFDYSKMARVFQEGGYIEGPGTGRSDSINAGIFQNGVKVQEARLSDGEFVMTEKAVRGLGQGDRAKGAAKMYEIMQKYERMA